MSKFRLAYLTFVAAFLGFSKVDSGLDSSRVDEFASSWDLLIINVMINFIINLKEFFSFQRTFYCVF